MANPQNLKKSTPTEARENGRKGGLASAKVRQERKAMKEMLIAMLEVIDEQTGTSTQEAMLKAQIDKAIAGDTKAFEAVRDTSGNKPQDHVKIDLNSHLQEMSTEQKELLAKEMAKKLGL